ncbi:helix-turn-helix transcriptional regulator [Aquabacterium sp.]|uniref:helix-turn-helix transcriptional regulator n=1 Tax=Aquabacterium sp. TaxID=1872578 RepID=UPI0037845DCE
MDVNEKKTAQGLIRLPKVLELFPVGRSTWYAGVKAGKYPPSVRVSERCVAWRTQDILELAATGNWQLH